MDSMSENEKTFEKDGIIYSLNDTTKTASINGTNSLSGDDIKIPRSVFYSDQEFIIKSIDIEAFEGAHIRSIQFSEDSELEIIEESAFSASSIESLTIPSSVSCLKNNWCYQMGNLVKVTIMPNNKHFKLNGNLVVGRISNESSEFDKIIFASRSIEDITIPPTIQNIGSCAFQYTKIREILIPKHVKTISSFAFANTDLKKVKIEKDSELEIIEDYSFSSTKIVSFFVPSHVKKIGKSTFYQCQRLEDVQFAPDSELQIIENDAFRSANLKTISIPKHVTKICESAFSGQHKLTNIFFPQDSELVTLEEDNFSNTSVKYLTIPSKVTNYNTCLLEHIIKVTIMPNNEYMKNYELDENLVVRRSSKDSSEFDEIIFVNREATEVTIPSNIKKIVPFAFANCNINSISIPRHLKEICEYAFYKCNLQNIEIPVDSELQLIGNHAFDQCNLQTIYIPSNIEHISECSFFGNKNMTTVEFAKDSKLQTIECGAFYDSAIESLTIPSAVTDIRGIISVPKLKNLTVMPDNEYFKNYELNKNLIIGRSSKESLEFDELIFVSKNVTDVTIPSNIKKIKGGAFIHIPITNIFIPSNITEIGASAFSYCEQLRTIEFAQDSKISIIEDTCFFGSSIEKINIPSSVTKIGSFAFNNCYHIKSVLFPCDSKLEFIDEYAFNESSIECIFIPSSIKTIVYGAFLSCPLKIFEFGSCDKDRISTLFNPYYYIAIYMVPNK